MRVFKIFHFPLQITAKSANYSNTTLEFRRLPEFEFIEQNDYEQISSNSIYDLIYYSINVVEDWFNEVYLFGKINKKTNEIFSHDKEINHFITMIHDRTYMVRYQLITPLNLPSLKEFI